MEKYRNDILGFSFDIPEKWELVPAQWTKNFRMKAAPTSEKLAEYLSKASAPFVFLHYPPIDEYSAIPVVQCVAKPLGILNEIGSIANIIDVALPAMEQAFKNFTLHERVDEMIFAGSKAGYLKMSMTVNNEQGVSFDCSSEAYYFCSSRALLMMGFSGAIDDARRPVEDFKIIQRSIRLS